MQLTLQSLQMLLTLKSSHYFLLLNKQVALEVLSYHNASSMNEVEELVTEGVPNEDPEIAK
jgi:hypothetical protein